MLSAPLGQGAVEVREGRARRRATLTLALTAALSFAGFGATAVASAKGRGQSTSRASASQYNVLTRFAVAQVAMPVYRQPSTHAPVLRKLAYYTPDSEALQTYRFLTSRRIGRTLWEKIAVPMRPNGQTGWVKRSWLGAVQTSNTLIVVSESREQLFVYRRGREIFSAPVGVGNTSGSYGTTTSTPTGHFWIAEAFASTDPFYGPWAFGTTDYASDTEFPDGSIVGIHGTNEPWLIPGDPSHGCVRLKNPDILKLKSLVGIGTAVWIEP